MRQLLAEPPARRLDTAPAVWGEARLLAAHVACGCWRAVSPMVSWCVDLAPITDPDVVPVTVARALGLGDQPGRSTMDTLNRFVR